MEINKINDLSFNQGQTKFCLSFDKGINVYSLEDFKLTEVSKNSENIGAISKAVILFSSDKVVFIGGGEQGKGYSNKDLVLYDLSNNTKTEKTFNEPITKLFSEDKYIFIFTENTKQLQIYSIVEGNFSEEIIIPLQNDVFTIWERRSESNGGRKNNKIFIAWYDKLNMQIQIDLLFWENNENCRKENQLKIKIDFNDIQNIFYIDKLSQIFVLDKSAIYITSYDINDGTKKKQIYRGNHEGKISSMCLVGGARYLAMVNCGAGIYFFDLDYTMNYFSQWLYGDYIYNIKKWKFKDFLNKGLDSFYETNNPGEGGGILCMDKNNNNNNANDKVLNYIGYNGFAYKIIVNFDENKFEVKDCLDFTDFTRKEDITASIFGKDKK